MTDKHCKTCPGEGFVEERLYQEAMDKVELLDKKLTSVKNLLLDWKYELAHYPNSDEIKISEAIEELTKALEDE